MWSLFDALVLVLSDVRVIEGSEKIGKLTTNSYLQWLDLCLSVNDQKVCHLTVQTIGSGFLSCMKIEHPHEFRGFTDLGISHDLHYR